MDAGKAAAAPLGVAAGSGVQKPRPGVPAAPVAASAARVKWVIKWATVHASCALSTLLKPLNHFADPVVESLP